MSRLRIAVLMGGTSGERDVSLASGAQVAKALRDGGHEVVAFDTARGVLSEEDQARLLARGVGIAPPDPGELDLLETGEITRLTHAPEMEGVDVILPVLHGGTGEDGTLQALLDLTGLPYAGSGRLGCTLSMDKEVSKRLFREAGIPTPDWIAHPAAPEEVVERLGLPLIVKPASGGSTLGLSLVKEASELEWAVALALEHDDRVLYEAFVRGRELTVGIVGDDALPVGEIIPEHEIFDYECKYQPGLAREVFPAHIPESVARRTRELAFQVHRTLFLRDFSRVDFILDDDGGLWCLEANAIPGMTSNSLLPRGAKAGGLPFAHLCDRIARTALARLGSGGTPPGGSG